MPWALQEEYAASHRRLDQTWRHLLPCHLENRLVSKPPGISSNGSMLRARLAGKPASVNTTSSRSQLIRLPCLGHLLMSLRLLTLPCILRSLNLPNSASGRTASRRTPRPSQLQRLRCLSVLVHLCSRRQKVKQCNTNLSQQAKPNTRNRSCRTCFRIMLLT